ncbi:MAG: electron transfer flavoprotein subunit beta/FixA family protein [Rhodothermales bacterium]|nr:electron transfer flavoprotein subunit beta/FixA family protein [Rhodothermales bacterium]MBO6781237.1 electron transfer flavoprotein subunit beta/FixA family protein [Rhodothermales bacterium]
MVLNAYDASAVEEALVLKEKHGGSVDLVLIGPEGARETIRKALAMGADAAHHIVRDDASDLDSNAVSEILAEFFSGQSFDVVATGKQSQDTDAGLAGSMLAERLGMPYASNAVGLDIDGDKLVVTRQGDAGQEVLEVSTPCLVTCSNDMNNPRIPSLKGIMAAKRKPVEQSESGAGAVLTTVSGLEPVPAREPGQTLEGEPSELASDVVNRLVNEAKVEL